jgi:hypothetical protein
LEHLVENDAVEEPAKPKPNRMPAETGKPPPSDLSAMASPRECAASVIRPPPQAPGSATG